MIYKTVGWLGFPIPTNRCLSRLVRGAIFCYSSVNAKDGKDSSSVDIVFSGSCVLNEKIYTNLRSITVSSLF